MKQWLLNIVRNILRKIFESKFGIQSNYDSYSYSMAELHTPKKPLEDITFVWCLVGNVIGSHTWGEKKEIKHGTKHFSPGAKLYCFPTLWGDGYEDIKVIGKRRKSKKMICVIMPSKYIINWRLDKVYKPYIIKKMYELDGWTDSDEDKNTIMEMVVWLNERTHKKNS